MHTAVSQNWYSKISTVRLGISSCPHKWITDSFFLMILSSLDPEVYSIKYCTPSSVCQLYAIPTPLHKQANAYRVCRSTYILADCSITLSTCTLYTFILVEAGTGTTHQLHKHRSSTSDLRFPLWVFAIYPLTVAFIDPIINYTLKKPIAIGLHSYIISTKNNLRRNRS